MLPLVVLLLLALLQAGLLLRDQLLVVQAAREGAREAAVSSRSERIEAAVHRAAPGLNDGLDVRIQRGLHIGDLTTVTIRARSTRVPVAGRVLGEHRLEASATMRIERVEHAEGAEGRAPRPSQRLPDRRSAPRQLPDRPSP